MMDFDEWLEWIPSLALKELSGGGEAVRTLKKPQVLDWVRRNPAAMARCRRSWEIEAESSAHRTVRNGTVGV